MEVAVLGGGNGSHAAALDITEAGHRVRFWRRDKDAVAALNARGNKLTLADFQGEREVEIAVVTAVAFSFRITLAPTLQISVSTALVPNTTSPDDVTAFVHVPPENVSRPLFVLFTTTRSLLPEKLQKSPRPEYEKIASPDVIAYPLSGVPTSPMLMRHPLVTTNCVSVAAVAAPRMSDALR